MRVSTRRSACVLLCGFLLLALPGNSPGQQGVVGGGGLSGPFYRYVADGNVWAPHVSPMILSQDELQDSKLLPFAFGLGLAEPRGEGVEERTVNISSKWNNRSGMVTFKITWKKQDGGWTGLATYKKQGKAITLHHRDGSWGLNGASIKIDMRVDGLVRRTTLAYDLSTKNVAGRQKARTTGSRLAKMRKIGAAPKKGGKAPDFQVRISLDGEGEMDMRGVAAVNAAIARAVWHLQVTELAAIWACQSRTSLPCRPGVAAIVGLALVECGVPGTDEMIRDLLDRLFSDKLASKMPTYDTGLSLMLLEAAARPSLNYDRGDEELKKRHIKTATQMARRLASGSGCRWNYVCTRNDVAGDNSNGQYAALGLRAAVELGIAVNETVWEDLIKGALRDMQDEAGRVVLSLKPNNDLLRSYEEQVRPASWYYNRKSKGKDDDRRKFNMTCAVLSNLAIASGMRKQYPEDNAQDAMRRGWAYVQKTLVTEGGLGTSDGYRFYGIERIGVFYKIDTVGGIDWYKDGAQELVSAQEEDGSWALRWSKDAKVGSRVDTAYALLFLKKATKPLEYDLGREKPGR